MLIIKRNKYYYRKGRNNTPAGIVPPSKFSTPQKFPVGIIPPLNSPIFERKLNGSYYAFFQHFFLPKNGGWNNPPPQKNLPCILSGVGLFRPLR